MYRLRPFLALCACVLPLMSCSNTSTAKKADVVIWHWMTDRQATFDKLAAQYEKETGDKVVFETYAPSEVYRDKVRAAASGGLLPEIYSPLGDKRETASFIKAGYIGNLSPALERNGWKDRFFKKTLENAAFSSDNEWGVPPGVYGIPIDVNAIKIYYNKDLFKQAGLDPEKPPVTWPEFIAAGKKLRAVGIQPFVSGFGEGWMVEVLAKSFEWNLLGKEGILDTIRGTIPYTDPRWMRVFNLFVEMRDAGLFASGIATMVNKDAERAFATGRAAMALNGSWGVNVYFSMNPSLNFSTMMPPRLPDGAYPVLISGGDGSSLYVNPASPRKDKAIAFLEWLTRKDQQVLLSSETRNIPSNREAAGNLSPVLNSFASDIDNTFDSLPMIEDWQVSNLISTSLQAIIIGEKNATEVAREIQAEKTRHMQEPRK